jgi:hypothetical protein
MTVDPVDEEMQMLCAVLKCKMQPVPVLSAKDKGNRD